MVQLNKITSEQPASLHTTSYKACPSVAEYHRPRKRRVEEQENDTTEPETDHYLLLSDDTENDTKYVRWSQEQIAQLVTADNDSSCINKTLEEPYVDSNERHIVRLVMEQAVATGNLSLVKWISEFVCKHSLHDELSDDIMSAAICRGHVDVAEYLVSVGQFEWYSVNYDLDEALRRGQFDVVDRIFKTCCLYPHTNDLFANIARSGLTNDMRYLYSQELVTPEMTEDAFRSACVGSTSSTMKYLLDTGSISSKMFDRFFEKRALFGKDSVLKFLYEQNRVSTPSLKRAFEYSRSLVAVKLLYQSGKILLDSVIVLFRNAANGGDVGGLPFPPNPEIVKFLLSES
ncbi:unnamed protein product [Phytophthora lilii]|uniref:Unnamed protein product n=1 Tax=Phytophthora lilii TaxID=2077276 RepID=A0A9W6TWS6_9STRA|nr:unnamed protein product [Phytophthora lilii]